MRQSLLSKDEVPVRSLSDSSSFKPCNVSPPLHFLLPQSGLDKPVSPGTLHALLLPAQTTLNHHFLWICLSPLSVNCILDQEQQFVELCHILGTFLWLWHLWTVLLGISPHTLLLPFMLSNIPLSIYVINFSHPLIISYLSCPFLATLTFLFFFKLMGLDLSCV